MDWIKQARLNTPSLVPGELEKEFSEFGEDADDDDQVHEDRPGDGGGIPRQPFSSSKLAKICLLDRTGLWPLSTE
jgi:hypothetical protein